MSMAISWKPQTVPPDGGFVGEAFLSLLTRGDSNLTEPELLVRESAQNSWDARIVGSPGPTKMDFRVQGVGRGDPLGLALREFFVGVENEAREVDVLSPLREVLKRERTSTLYVRDSGTCGLGGIDDASIPAPEGVRDSYVRFLLNIGHKNQDPTAGGSYGLGRSVFWRMSTCSTVVVYTRFRRGSGFGTRLVGLTLTGKFDLEGRVHTGRHFWTTSDVGKPLTDATADEWASRLGFDTYTGSETGLTVMVVAPDSPLSPQDPNQGSADLAGAIARSIELHLWPKYVSSLNRDPSELMQFSVRNGDASVEVRDYQRDSKVGLGGTPLGCYVEAFEKIHLMSTEGAPETTSRTMRTTRFEHNFQGKKLEEIKVIGLLALKSLPTEQVKIVQPTESVDEGEETPRLESAVNSKIESLRNSVALMRTPELVVAYKDIGKHCGVDCISFGVFRADPTTNSWFRMAESSTHTEWSSTVLPGRDPDDVKSRHPAFRVLKAFEEKLKDQLRQWFPARVPDEGAGDKETSLRLDEVSRIIGETQSFLERGVGWLDDDDDDDDDDDGDDKDDDDREKRKRFGKVAIADSGLMEDPEHGVLNFWEVGFEVIKPCRLVLELHVAMDDGQGFEKVDQNAQWPRFESVEISEIKEKAVPAERSVVLKDIQEGIPIGNDLGESKKSVGKVKVKVAFEPGTIPALRAKLVKP